MGSHRIAKPKTPPDPPAVAGNRPHNISIVLGLLTLFFAVIALVLNYKSLQTSQSSLKIGQRGYLAFAVTSFTVTQEGSPQELTARATMKIRNVGNTPAYLDTGQSHINSVNIRTNQSSTRGGGSLLPPGLVVPPKDEVPGLDAFVSFADPEEATCPNSPNSKCYFVRFTGDISWHDVFGETHVDSWCTTLIRRNVTDMTVESCTPAQHPPK
jgi:hypothetical protein